MNGRNVSRILLVLLLVLAAAGIAVVAYNAGMAQGLAAAGQPSAPGVFGPYRGYPGPYFFPPFGFFFGFLGLLLVVFLIVGLVRALTWGGRRGWADRGHWPESRWAGGGPTFEEWHRRAHAEGREETGAANT
ncbi:MAG: hypothetical protein M3301_06450, partial [Chloroflexota bacterium]|nr:hypothetical protein [Chloroflexota bacterium]